jgi:uncharacterized protein (DUF433 family)
VPLIKLRRIANTGDHVLRNKPVRRPDQEISTLPTYTIPEAAEALAIPVRTLFDWYAGKYPVLRPSGQIGNIVLLSFQDLEEAYKVHILRSRERLSLQYLREAMTEARESYGSEHPLIDNERDIAVFFEKKKNKLVMSFPGRGRRKRRSVALASPETATYIPEVVKVWGKRIVSRKQIFPWKFFTTDEQRPVSLNPEVMSGRLVVTGTRIPVEVLRRRKASGERPEKIADDYGISLKRVQNALTHVEASAKKAA